MAFERPTLSQLRERIANDFEFRIAGSDAHTPGTGYTELAQVIAGVAHGLYGNQQWIAAQRFVYTADDDIVEAEAVLRDIPRIPAAFATGAVTFTGNNGTPISANVMLQAGNGQQFHTTTNGIIAGGSCQLAVIAQEPGRAGNLTTGTALTLINPIVGVDSTALIAAPGLANGADIELIARVRERVLAHIQQPPMGGKQEDYVAWARAAAVDVTRAWVFPHEDGIGSVALRCVTENLSNPIPAAGVLTAVSDYIQSRRPAGLRSFTVKQFTAVPMNLVFTALSLNTAETRAAIEAEVKDLIRRRYQPGGVLLLSQIREAISRAGGENNHVITLSTDLSYTNSQFPVWGTPTWPAV